MKSVATVGVTLQASRALAVFVAGAALATIVLIVLTALALPSSLSPLALLCVAAVGVWWCFAWRTHIQRRGVTSTFILGADGVIEWQQPGQTTPDIGELCEGCVVGLFWLIIRWRNTNNPRDPRLYSLTLLADMMHPDQWRQLKVMVKRRMR